MITTTKKAAASQKDALSFLTPAASKKAEFLEKRVVAVGDYNPCRPGPRALVWDAAKKAGARGATVAELAALPLDGAPLGTHWQKERDVVGVAHVKRMLRMSDKRRHAGHPERMMLALHEQG